MGISPAVMQRYQQLVAQGVPSMQAYAQAMHEVQTGTAPQGMAGIPGVQDPASALGMASVSPSAPLQTGIAAPLRPQPTYNKYQVPGSPINAPGGPNSPMPAGDQGGQPPASQGPSPQAEAPSQDNPPSRDDSNKGSKPSDTSNDSGSSDSGGTTNAANQPANPGGQGGTDAALNTPELARQSFFGFGPNDNLSSYGSRIFMGGQDGNLPGFGGQNFYDERTAGSPWGMYLRQRFAPEVTSDLALANLSGNVADMSEPSQEGMARNVLQQLASGGGTGNASGLHQMGDILNAGNFDGLNGAQANAAKLLVNDPSAQAQVIAGKLRSLDGGWGYNYDSNQLANLTQQYRNNMATMTPGSFTNYALSKLGY